MISVPFEDTQKIAKEIDARDKELAPPPISFFPYLKRCLEEDREATKMTFPCDIKVAPKNKYLLKGDYTPSQIIHLDSPVMSPEGVPMWLGQSSSEIALRFGYENLDARKLCTIKMNGEYIHGFLGGSSGHGKSVTLNALLGVLCYEYAPWELEVNLSDAKILEFKRYGIGHHIPHIAAIAATEDPDFVISVLETKVNEMKERAKIFAMVGSSDLKEFRKVTGLAMPRVLILMDEVESTFRMAGKQANKIANLIDDFARLGRAAGYHLYMATQNMSSDIPSSAVGQIRIRCCLGAVDKVSNAILGNSGATENFGRRGRLIVNTEVLNGGDTAPHNRKYQTPFLRDEEFEYEMATLEAKGKEVGYLAHMAFYDENDVKTVEQFDPLIESSMARMKAEREVTSKDTPIILGYPAFVTEDSDGLLKLRLDQKDVENILICSTSVDHTSALLHNITKCLAMCDHAIQLFTTDMEHKEWVCNPMVVLEARNAEQAPLNSIGALVRKRLFLLHVDGAAEHAKFDRASIEELFARDKIPQEHWGNELLCQRAVAFQSLLKQKEWEDLKSLFPNLLSMYEEYNRYHCLTKKLTSDDFKKAVFVVGDLSKIIGYGRDTRSKYVTELKKAMQDSNRVGVLFVLFSRSMEGLNELGSGLRYTIFDLPDTRDWGRLRTEAPAMLAAKLALVFDNADTEKPQKKFKRTLLKEEL